MDIVRNPALRGVQRSTLIGLKESALNLLVALTPLGLGFEMCFFSNRD